MANLVEIFEKTLSCMLLLLRKHLRSVKNKLAVVPDIWYYDFSECNKQKKKEKKRKKLIKSVTFANTKKV